MNTPAAVKAIIEKESFSREEQESYERFIGIVADMLMGFYNEKYAKSAENITDNSTKSVEK